MGGRGRRGKGKGFGKRGFPFALFLLLSISLFAPATEACGYQSSDINIQRPVLDSSIFVGPSVNEKPALSNVSTLESVFERMRFG